jgi:FkbM family methyltransferase
VLESIRRLRDYLLASLVLATGPRSACSIFWKQTKNLRVRLKLAAHRPEEIYSLQTIYGRLYFRDNFGDVTNLVDLFYHQVYRTKALSPAGAILDVGANIGLSAALFSHYNPGRTIYCFEPLDASARLIRLNCPGARVQIVAVGASSGGTTLHVDPDKVMASRLPCNWQTTRLEFATVSLDEFAGDHALDQIAFLKIDVEGMEVEIMNGAEKVLNMTHRVALETHSRSLHNEAIERLELAGFEIESQQFNAEAGMVIAFRGTP